MVSFFVAWTIVISTFWIYKTRQRNCNCNDCELDCCLISCGTKECSSVMLLILWLLALNSKIKKALQNLKQWKLWRDTDSDNIFATNSEINDISGILLNHISDHQMVFTYVENFSCVKMSPKYIQLERHDDQSLNNFIDVLKFSNICEQLQDHVDSNPQDNYELFHRLLQNAKDKHLPKKRVRYDKKKHKSSKWMTNGILKSINTKDRMYKKLL